MSALTAAELGREEISGLILFYPALCIPDDARQHCGQPKSVNPHKPWFIELSLGDLTPILSYVYLLQQSHLRRHWRLISFSDFTVNLYVVR